MKNIFIVSIILSSLLFSSSISSEEITSMIESIKEERVGIALSKLENTSNPFLIVKKEKKVVKHVENNSTKAVYHEVEYKLYAILNNAAFINGKWYKRGSKIGLYRVTYIGSKSVKLVSENETKTLSIKKKKNKFMNLNKGSK